MTNKPYCNFFWGSHGCDLPPGHEGNHLCGLLDGPCSRHDGARVQYHLVGGDWDTEWFASEGFSL